MSERENRQNHSSEQNVQSDLNRLPCEFCQVPITASELASHQVNSARLAIKPRCECEGIS